jgi:glycine/D-amino acid oxidase-like deaminating enzyme
MAKTYDVIVVGGGIMGCSSAYHLAKKGLRVALLEKDQIAAGGSGKSSAIIRQHYSNELTARMALHSLRVFQHFDDQVGGDPGFTTTGFIAIAAAQDQQGLQANVNLQQRVGINTRLISPEELREVMPGMQTADLVAAAYEPESGYADPYLTVQAYAQAARRHGAEIFQDHAVTALIMRDDRVAGVRTAHEEFQAPAVVNCTGAWSPRLARDAGLALPIHACRVQVAFFRRPSGHESPHPVVADFIHATYFRDETGAQTLLGLIDPAEAEAVIDPDSFVEQVDSEFVLDAGERLVKRYPIMERSLSVGGYASFYGVTPDWHPIIDETPPGSGFYTCAGFSGHGFKLGPAVGQMIADMVSGESEPLFDGRLFRLPRFAEDDLVRGQYEYSIAG